MNVKKMFASVAGVLMLAQVVAPMVTGAATYSDELQGAYEYAYAQGITTMGSIDNANMYGDLTRGQLSKMISQWAEKEMGVKADETAVCSFTDTDTAEGDLGTYVVKACQMGLMGQGIEKFRPGDKVTRGEFGTVLSRAIWGDKYNSENPFYAKHLQALKDAGIMNNISDPNATEMRGWVMLMLQRAAENVNPSECNDPAVLLACSLGSDSCPAACVNKSNTEDEDNTPVSNINDMPIAGDLTVAVADYSDTIKSVPARGTVIFNAVDFKASEKVVIESVKLERTGLSDKSAIK
jgi:predicted alpha/beta hydrolase family esterase